MAVQTGQMCNADALLAEEGAREKIFNGLGTHLKKKKKKGGGKKRKEKSLTRFSFKSAGSEDSLLRTWHLRDIAL